MVLVVTPGVTVLPNIELLVCEVGGDEFEGANNPVVLVTDPDKPVVPDGEDDPNKLVVPVVPDVVPAVPKSPPDDACVPGVAFEPNSPAPVV